MPVEVTPARNTRLGWNTTTREQLRRYLEHLLTLLRLSDHHLTVDLSEPSDECAEVHTTPGQRHVTLYLSAGFLSQPPRWQQETLLHELIHLHLNPLVHLTDAATDAVLEPAAHQVLCQALWSQVELPSDTLATVIADLTDPPTFGAAGDTATAVAS